MVPHRCWIWVQEKQGTWLGIDQAVHFQAQAQAQDKTTEYKGQKTKGMSGQAAAVVTDGYISRQCVMKAVDAWGQVAGLCHSKKAFG